MAAQVVAQGAWAYAAGNPAPTYPVNSVGNRMYLIVYWKASVTTSANGPTTPAGWTEVAKQIPDTSLNQTGGYTANGIDTGNVGWAVYYIDVTTVLSGTLTVTMTSTNVAAAKLVSVSKSSGYIWDDTPTPVYTSGWRTTTPTSPLSIVCNVSADIALKDFDLVLAGMAIPTDVGAGATFSAQSFSHSGTTFNTFSGETEVNTASGQDLGGWFGYITVFSGTNSPSQMTITATLAGTLTNVRGPAWAVRIRDKIDTPPPTVTDYWGSAA